MVKDKGNRPKYRGLNNEEKLFATFLVDDCLIKEKKIKCDFLIVNCEEKIAYFIELKGSDVVHALRQIGRSINVLEKYLDGHAVCARIVPTKKQVTNLYETEFKKLRNAIKKTNKQKGRKLEQKLLIKIEKKLEENL